MIRGILFSMVVVLAGCQNTGGHNLQWQFPDGSQLLYDAVYAEVQADTALMVSGFEVLDSDRLKVEIKRALSELDLPDASYLASVEDMGHFIRGSLVGIEPADRKPVDGREFDFAHSLLEANAGMTVLLGDFSKSGEPLSFFFPRRQQSLSNVLFSLPAETVSPGDSWSLDFRGVELESGFIPDNARRDAKAFFESIGSDNQGRPLAELFYVISEEVSGHYRFKGSDGWEEVHLEVSFSFFAHAHFLIEDGRWQDFTAVGIHSSSGTDLNQSAVVYGLRPLKK